MKGIENKGPHLRIGRGGRRNLSGIWERYRVLGGSRDYGLDGMVVWC